ncbi:UNVERIFIED_CONTAM: hypothetical protein Slati_2267500 [Sesamum latifolium]|uniref:CCHC-type domain-containing protein n=1 Tax=Sesamum latifolium TaxID=2727402 RepID=A0AAW2WVH9_9LAMI
METNKFNGANYNDWLRNLRIVLDFENQDYVLDKSLPTALPEGSSSEEHLTFGKWHEDNRKERFRPLKRRQGCQMLEEEEGQGTAVTATASTGGAPPAAPKGKGKGKVGSSQQSKANDVCMHCQRKGHWKRECPQLLSNPGMYVIEVQERSRRLSKDEMILKLGDGKAIVAEAVGSLRLLGYALETAAKLLNIAPSKSVPQTPYEIWHGKPAFYKYLRVWGSPAYVKRLVGDKLDSRSSLCRCIGYPKETAGYYFYDLAEQKIFYLENAVFLTKDFSSDSRRDEVLIEESNEEPHHDSTTSFEPTVHTDGLQSSVGQLENLEYPRAWYDYEIWQMDVRTAFLNGFIEEQIFMDQLEGFTTVGEEQRDMGETAYILGIKIYRDRSRRMLGLTQSSHIKKVLKRFKMEYSKRGVLPMRHGIMLSKKQSPKTDEELKRMSNIHYASAVGSIQYAIQCNRPDVAYALSVTSRYQACTGRRTGARSRAFLST